MKKTKLLLLATLLVSGSLVSCGGGAKEKTYKAGLGQAISITRQDNVITQIDITFASVVFDNDKVVSTYVDVVQLPIVYTPAAGETAESYAYKADAKQVEDAGAKNVETKKELKERYGMSAIGAVEWNVQAATFESWAEGKKTSELTVTKAEADDNHSHEWTNSITGCTMLVDDFITAIKNASNHAVEFKAKEAPKAGVGVIVGAAGSQIDITFASAATTGDVVNASVVDVYQIPLKNGDLDAANKGVAHKLEGTDFASKFELKEHYGMSAIGAKEWNVQAEAFQTWTMGKKVSELTVTKAEADDNHSHEWTNSITGCTMLVDDFISAIKEASTNRR